MLLGSLFSQPPAHLMTHALQHTINNSSTMRSMRVRARERWEALQYGVVCLLGATKGSRPPPSLAAGRPALVRHLRLLHRRLLGRRRRLRPSRARSATRPRHRRYGSPRLPLATPAARRACRSPLAPARPRRDRNSHTPPGPAAPRCRCRLPLALATVDARDRGSRVPRAPCVSCAGLGR